jgi:hypothetical protein
MNIENLNDQVPQISTKLKESCGVSGAGMPNASIVRNVFQQENRS